VFYIAPKKGNDIINIGKLAKDAEYLYRCIHPQAADVEHIKFDMEMLQEILWLITTLIF